MNPSLSSSSVTLFALVLLAGCGASPAAPAVAPPASTPASTPSSKPSAALAPGGASACPDDLRVSMAVNGVIDGDTPARFVFEGMTAKLDALPSSALPPEFDRKDPRAYTSGGQGSSSDLSRPIPRKLALELGASDDDAPIAVYNEDGAPPCIGKPGDYHAVLRAEGWYEPYVELQRRIVGCEPRKSEHGPAFTARSSAPLDRCQFRVPARLAGATFPSIDGKTPAKIEGKLPADLEKFGPPEACAAPGCLRAFFLQGVEPAVGPSLYALSISQLRTKPHDAECEVYAEQRCSYVHSLLLRPSPGAAPTKIDLEESELAAVFLDEGGARFFVALTRGGMAVERLRPGAAPLVVKSVQTYHPHPEDSDFESHSSCPYCGP